jgi:hypothetical protein
MTQDERFEAGVREGLTIAWREIWWYDGDAGARFNEWTEGAFGWTVTDPEYIAGNEGSDDEGRDGVPDPPDSPVPF